MIKPVSFVTIFIASFVLFIALTGLWYIIFLSDFNIPEFIPYTPIKPFGLGVLILLITILIIAQKLLIKAEPTISIGKLTLAGTIIGFIGEIESETIALIAPASDKMHYFFVDVAIISLYAIVISFLVAYQLKTKKTSRLILFVIGSLILMDIGVYLFHAFSG